MPNIQSVRDGANGRWRLRRKYTFAVGTWNQIDFRTAGWFDEADFMVPSQQAKALSNGVLRSVAIKVTGGTSVLVSNHATNQADYCNTCLLNEFLDTDYFPGNPNSQPSTIWLLATAGTETVEFEIFFDIEGS